MKIVVEEYYDGFAIVVDGEHFGFDQEDSVIELVDVLRKINPEAEVVYEDIY